MRTVAELETQPNLSSASRRRIQIARDLAVIIASCDSNIQEVQLFGSTARGTATSKSDIDLNIITRSQRQPFDDLDFRLGLEVRVFKTIRKLGYKASVHHQNRLPSEKFPLGIDFGVYTDGPNHTTYEFPVGPAEERVTLVRR